MIFFSIQRSAPLSALIICIGCLPGPKKRYNANHEESLPVITLYGCRHTFATTNYERGESDKVLSEIMGNTPATFLQKYAHIHGDRKQQSLDAFENIIFKSGNEN